MEELTQTIESTSTHERLKAIFDSLDVRAKLCMAIMWKIWSLERSNFNPALREEIERDLLSSVHDLTHGDCGDPELNWLAGFWRACELVADNTNS